MDIIQSLVKRKAAMAWWNSLTFEEQMLNTVKWLSSQGKDTTEVHPYNLDSKRIQEIQEFINKNSCISCIFM